MNRSLDIASKLLQTASAYAKDGAVFTAVDRAEQALVFLEKEKQRRKKMGLYPKDIKEKE